MKQVWTRTDWTRNPALKQVIREGFRLRFDRGIDPELRLECLAYAKWLRENFRFPVRVRVYIRNQRRIRAKDGELVCGTFWRPFSYTAEPYIRIAAGDFGELCAERGHDGAVYETLLCLTHELTHYFQWLNGLELTPRGEERQAARCAALILDQYW